MMSEDGTRVFFQSPDPLVGADVNGVPDVYEWENGHVYLISGGNAPDKSSYYDNSSTGGDVFFLTEQGLIPSDEDEENDVYDARIPRPGDQPPVNETPCSGEVCQGPPSVPQVTLTAGERDLRRVGEHSAGSRQRNSRSQKADCRDVQEGFRQEERQVRQAEEKEEEDAQEEGEEVGHGQEEG